MQSREKTLDDLARFAGGAVTVMSGVTRQVREEIRARVDEFATRLDLVPREDFERLEAMLDEARREQNRLAKRIEALEKRGAPKKSSKKARRK